ncbi:MAG: hypothetical protein ACRESC_00315 [Gammaproteobacteria bacterium]
MIIVPDIHEEGFQSAMTGTKMCSHAQPMGFTFNPYAEGTVEHYNFMNGVVQAHFDDGQQIRGEPGPM